MSNNLYGEYNTSLQFDGDIVITDPCYIMRDRNKTQYIELLNSEKAVYPERKDYYSINSDSIPRPQDYPDYQINPNYQAPNKNKEDSILDEINNLLRSLERLSAPNNKVNTRDKMYSPTYTKENEAYHAALDKYYSLPHDDWDYCEYGEEMSKLGFTNSLVASTVYGDWSCTTYKLCKNSKRKIGSFCADAGLVGVFYLSEILKYNPNYDINKETKFAATLIKDYHGSISINKSYNKEEDEYEASVVGMGNIIFFSSQTGL